MFRSFASMEHTIYLHLGKKDQQRHHRLTLVNEGSQDGDLSQPLISEIDPGTVAPLETSEFGETPEMVDCDCFDFF